MKYIWLVMAAAFVIMALWLMLQTVRCKTPVRARFIDVHIMKSAGMKDYFPIFRYTFEDCEYNVRSVQSFSGSFIKKHFVSGHIINHNAIVTLHKLSPFSYKFFRFFIMT